MSATCTSAAAVMNDPKYPRLRSLLIETTGLSYYLNQEQELAARITSRMAAIELAHVDEYLAWLSDATTGETEWNALVAELTIGETYFFRHQEQFDALRDRVLPDIIQRNQRQRRIRIWSAGCATGAELYSIAILLQRDLAQLAAGWDITLIGTDVNRDFLACAQRGEFADWTLRSLSPEVKRECFSRSGGLWIIRPEYRPGVSFQHHNLVQHPIPSLLNNLSAFDLILCRNVMIYFERQVVGRLVGQLHDCLVEGGWFLVGHAESNVELFRAFRTINVPGAVLYQKEPSLRRHHQPNPCPVERIAQRGAAHAAAPSVSSSPAPRAKEKAPPLRPTITAVATGRSIDALPDIAERLADIRAQVDRAQWDEAVRACEGLIESTRLNPTAHFYHALVLDQIGDAVEAERALRRAIYLDRNFVLAHYHLGLVLQKRGHMTAAKRSYRSTVKLLDHLDGSQLLDDADGLTVSDLKQWTQTHLDVLNCS